MRVRRKGTIARIFVALSVLMGAVAIPQPTLVQAQTLSQNPVSILAQNDPGVIPGEYIVVMKDGVSNARLSATIASVEPTGFRRLGAEPFKRFTSAITGFAGKLSSSELEKLAADPNVAFPGCFCRLPVGHGDRHAERNIDGSAACRRGSRPVSR